MKALIRRIKRHIADDVKYAARSREWMGWLWLFRGVMTRDKALRGTRLARALGFAMSERLRGICISKLNACPGIDGAAAVWTEVARRNARYGAIPAQCARRCAVSVPRRSPVQHNVMRC